MSSQKLWNGPGIVQQLPWLLQLSFGLLLLALSSNTKAVCIEIIPPNSSIFRYWICDKLTEATTSIGLLGQGGPNTGYAFKNCKTLGSCSPGAEQYAYRCDGHIKQGNNAKELIGTFFFKIKCNEISNCAIDEPFLSCASALDIGNLYIFLLGMTIVLIAVPATVFIMIMGYQRH